MQTLPYPIYLVVDDGGYIRFTTVHSDCSDNLLAIFSLQDLIKLHFLLVEFEQRDAIFLLEAGGVGSYKTKKNCIPGDHWCIGVGLAGINKDRTRASLSNDWFRHESRGVAYRVNPDVRVWITWPAMHRILNTLDHDVCLILERENRRAPRRFVPSNDPMLQVLGPSPSNAAYIKAICESMFMKNPIPPPRSTDDLYIALGRASAETSITPRATKIPKNQYANFYKMCVDGIADTVIAEKYSVSRQTVSRTIYSIGSFVYKCREHAWNAWEVWFEELTGKYHASLFRRTL